MPIVINLANVRVPLKTYDQRWRIVYVDAGNEIVIGDNSTSDTNRIMLGSFTRRSLRYGIGNFNISLLNDKGYFNTLLKKATKIRVYADHTTDNPTNQIFEGRIDSKKHSLSSTNELTLNIYGRGNPQIADKHITKDFSTGAGAGNAIKAIIDDNFSGVFTYNGIPANMTDTIYGEYINQPALSVISDILKQISWHGYIDFADDIKTFKQGSVRNLREKLVYGDNMLGFGEIGRDYIDEKNRVTVYGQTGEGLLLLRTKEDTNLQSESWIKSDVMSVGNLTGINTVNQKAQVELDFQKQIPQIGTLSAANGLPTLQPGQSIFCGCQFAEITGFYDVPEFTHSLSQEGAWITTININRLDKTIFTQIKETEKRVTAISSQNINEMDNTAILLKFDDSTGIDSLGGAVLADSRLKIGSGTQTTTISSIVTMDKNVASFEARAKPNDDCTISYFQVSNDGGLTFNDSNKQYTLVGDLNKKISFTTIGKRVQVRIVLKSDSNNSKPELDNFVLLTKS